MKNQVFIERNNNSRNSNGIQNKNEEDKIFTVKKHMTFRQSNMIDSQVKFITKKSFNERTECKNKSSDNFISKEGRWSKEEHEKFLEGIVIYDINWKKVKTLIQTRTNTQVRSHAQKFFYKMKGCKDESLGIDFTSNTVRNIRDMINQIKNNNSNYNVINVFKYLADKCNDFEKFRKNANIGFQRNEINNQSNIINLREDNSNINDNNNFFFNQNNNNKRKRMKETFNINDNEPKDIEKMINYQNNIFNILQNLLIMNYKSNLFNCLLTNNLYSSIYDTNNNANKLLIDYLNSNSDIINENVLLSLALQNNILNNSINDIHNINNNINLNDTNFCININNYNTIRNINNGNNIDKVNDNDKNSLFNNIAKKNNINLGNNNDYNYYIGNKDNKNYNININKNDFIFCSDKQLNKISDKKKNNNDENSDNNNIFN